MANMNYIYNVKYFESLKKTKKGFELDNVVPIIDNTFSEEKLLEKVGAYSFELKTSYPGLLVGLGNPHEIKSKDAIKCGFTFDFVTGLPFLPGSSLKGILRSAFPEGVWDSKNGKWINPKDKSKATMVKALLKKQHELTDMDVCELRDAIFEHEDMSDYDVFYDVFPIFIGKAKILDEEYITPHKSEIENPVPIKLIKVKPDVKFKFKFDLYDTTLISGKTITASQKKELFIEIIKILGIGAKTNVGFGRMI